MKQNAWTLSIAAVLLLISGPLAAAEECAPTGAQPFDKLAPSVFDPCFENVTFGETRQKTTEHNANRVKGEYGVLMLAEKSATAKDELKKRMDDDVAGLTKGYTDFTGGATGFDASPLANDFAKHADEGVLEISRGTDRVYYFYSRDQLWKIVWVMDASQSFDDVKKHVTDTYGKGTAAKAAAKIDAKIDAKVATWESKALRLELVDQRPVFNAYVLRWIAKDVAPKVEAYRREKGAVPAVAPATNLGEDDVFEKAMGKPDKVDDVADDILGKKPNEVPDVVGKAKAEKEEKDKAKGIIKKKTKVLKEAPGPKPKGLK